MRTTVVNIRYDKNKENFVYIGRGSKWGNPYTHMKGKTKAQFLVSSREESVEKYEEWIRQQPNLLSSLHELKFKRLGCFCAPAKCHGDILVKLVEEMEEKDDFWDEF